MVTDNYPDNTVPNYNRIIDVPEWTTEAFENAAILTEAFLCPEDISLKLTEIRMEEYNNGGLTYRSRFVEFYNDGERLDLTKGNLVLTGLVNSSPFGYTGNASCDLIIEPNQYIVFYDPSLDVPECIDCDCFMPEVVTRRLQGGSGDYLHCNDSIYIPCGGSGISGCGSCTWDDTMVYCIPFLLLSEVDK